MTIEWCKKIGAATAAVAQEALSQAERELVLLSAMLLPLRGSAREGGDASKGQTGRARKAHSTSMAAEVVRCTPQC